MRISVKTMLLSSLLMLLAMTLSAPRAAIAQTVGAGACLGATETDFSPGLGTTLSQQSLTINAIFYGCNFLTNPAPVSFNWSGTIQNAGCLAVSAQNPPGTGLLKWQNGQTSTLQFTSLTYTGVTGAVPAVLTFYITQGYKQGGSFQATAALLPTPYQVPCSNTHPVTELTGQITSVTFTNIGL